MANVLIIEDDEVFSELLFMFMEDHGHFPQLAPTLDDARQKLANTSPDIILLDQELPDGYGINLLQEIVEDDNHPPVIMITGVPDNKLIMQAMRVGAKDFIRKPLDEKTLENTLESALKSHRLTRQIAEIAGSDEYQVDIGQIIGNSPSIIDICKVVGTVAPSNAPILITGESGTGKEVIARSLHHHSEREGQLLPVNCSALAENLLESELFGHEKGSFTGAVAAKQGKFELTEDGTLFLDELGEMPPGLQAKLLRVLQEGTFERVGGTRTLHTNARIIAATNRNLEQMITDGTFREDLFYRLNVVHIHLPPLRERMEDLPLLTEHLLNKINARQNTEVKHLAENAWDFLNSYHWPGNIRELENILTRAAILAKSDTITFDELDLPELQSKSTGASTQDDECEQKIVSLEEVESEHIKGILGHTRWHKGKACEILGISRPALDRKILKYQLG